MLFLIRPITILTPSAEAEMADPVQVEPRPAGTHPPGLGIDKVDPAELRRWISNERASLQLRAPLSILSAA